MNKQLSPISDKDAIRIRQALQTVLQTNLVDRIPSIGQIPVPTVRKVQKLASGMNAPVKAWMPLDNVWNIAGLKADETRNARVLAWYLDQEGGHGLGALVLYQFLNYLDLATQGRCQVMVEKYPDGLGASRVDILLDDPSFVVIIEIKIKADEQPEQIFRYSSLAAQRAGTGRKWKVVYLTRTGKAAKTAPAEQEHVVSMSWGMFACFLRDSSRKCAEIPAFLANNFARHIGAKEGINADE